MCIIVLGFAAKREQMAVMRFVWPITAWYYGPFAVWAFLRNRAARQNRSNSLETFVSATHCGAGCTLGDIIGEWAVYFAGWTLGRMLFAQYVVDFSLAYIFGIIFQYYAIAPMRGLGFREGILAALKADTLALVTFEIGLFGWMAFFQLVLFPGIQTTNIVYWLMMQIGMIIGFWTSYPMNALLLRLGIKEPM